MWWASGSPHFFDCKSLSSWPLGPNEDARRCPDFPAQELVSRHDETELVDHLIMLAVAGDQRQARFDCRGGN